MTVLTTATRETEPLTVEQIERFLKEANLQPINWYDLAMYAAYGWVKAQQRIAEMKASNARLRRVGRAAQAIPWPARSTVSAYDRELYEAQAALLPGDLDEGSDSQTTDRRDE